MLIKCKRVRSLFIAFYLFCVVATVTSCSAQAVSVATYTPRGEGGDSAALTGTFRLTEGCLYVQTSGEGLFLPVFPRNEIEVKDGDILYAGASLNKGERVELGGSEKDRQTLSDLEVEIPGACQGASRYWMVASE